MRIFALLTVLLLGACSGTQAYFKDYIDQNKSVHDNLLTITAKEAASFKAAHDVAVGNDPARPADPALASCTGDIADMLAGLHTLLESIPPEAQNAPIVKLAVLRVARLTVTDPRRIGCDALKQQLRDEGIKALAIIQNPASILTALPGF